MNVYFQIAGSLIQNAMLRTYRLFFFVIIILIITRIYCYNNTNKMIATYVNVKTYKEVYVQDFTANLINEDGKKSKEKIVIYKTADNISTFVVLKKKFDKEYKKK